MLLRSASIALLLVAATALAVAPTAAACQPSPQCVVTGTVGIVLECTDGDADCIAYYVAGIVLDCARAAVACAFDTAGTGVVIVQAYLDYAQYLYCTNVGVGC